MYKKSFNKTRCLTLDKKFNIYFKYDKQNLIRLKYCCFYAQIIFKKRNVLT